MYKKFVVNSILLLTTFSVAHAQPLTATQKSDADSAVSILKEIQDQNISKEDSKDLSNVLSQSKSSDSSKSMALSYINSGLSYSDFSKLENGIYIINNQHPELGSTPDATCLGISSDMAYCIPYEGSVCYGNIGSNGCHN